MNQQNNQTHRRLWKKAAMRCISLALEIRKSVV